MYLLRLSITYSLVLLLIGVSWPHLNLTKMAKDELYKILHIWQYLPLCKVQLDQSCLRNKRQVQTICIKIENLPLLEMSFKRCWLRSPQFIHSPIKHLFGTYWVPSTFEVLRIQQGKMTRSLLWQQEYVSLPTPTPPPRRPHKRYHLKRLSMGIPWPFSVRILCFRCQAQIQSLVRELRSCNPCGMAKKRGSMQPLAFFL